VISLENSSFTFSGRTQVSWRDYSMACFDISDFFFFKKHWILVTSPKIRSRIMTGEREGCSSYFLQTFLWNTEINSALLSLQYAAGFKEYFHVVQTIYITHCLLYFLLTEIFISLIYWGQLTTILYQPLNFSQKRIKETFQDSLKDSFPNKHLKNWGMVRLNEMFFAFPWTKLAKQIILEGISKDFYM
jgi:hypothetical protein